MTLRRDGAIGLIMVSLLISGGCGYSLRAGLPSGIKTVFVPTLVNKTQEPGIEDSVTQALIQAVIGTGAKIAGSAQSADASLEGSIIEYQLTGLAFDSSSNVTQYRLRIALALTLRDLKKNEVIWKQDRIEDRADFPVSAQLPQTVAIASQQDAVKRAAVEVTRAIVSFAFEGF
jgi:hypothetical protein